MKFDDIEILAEQLFKAHGAMADLEALKQSDKLRATGDVVTSQMWLQVTDRIREIQNLRHTPRTA